jgi:hypothetical protein
MCCAAQAEYSWREPHAQVLPQGDLAWAPKPFVFQAAAGESLRYIDYETGDDVNDGRSPSSPWKHHPWDDQATAEAKACSGIHTYLFKRGVIYRGRLTGRESGEPGRPIRLTSDPAWGEGEAALYGSERISKGWKLCTSGDAPPALPDAGKVWFVDLGTQFQPGALWVDQGKSFQRIPVARTPNWTISNWSDPQAEMAVSDGTAEQAMKLADPLNLFDGDPAYFAGMRCWREYPGNMGTLTQNHIVYNPEKNTIGIYDPKRKTVGFVAIQSRFFLENHAAFLDQPGEFYYASAGPYAGRLYLRLPDDRDPNQAQVEVSRYFRTIYLPHASHIEISGLRFSFDDAGPRAADVDFPNRRNYPAAIYLMGNCSDIRVANNRFAGSTCGVIGMTRGNSEFNQQYFTAGELCTEEWRRPGAPDRMDGITVEDNEFEEIDRRAVSLEDISPSLLTHVRVMRNRIYNCGHRGTAMGWDSLPAIYVGAVDLCEIAGNMIEKTWGCGIVTFGGKASGDTSRSKPHIRILIHHNRVVDSLLVSNDWGGIAPWQGGPNYIYNNVSANAVGPKHNAKDSSLDWGCNAYCIYLDGTYKSYVFNNITWGREARPTAWPRNRAGFMQVLGFLNDWFNNSGYNMMYGITGWSGQRCLFGGNAFENLTVGAFSQNSRDDVSLRGGGMTADKIEKMSQAATLAYTRNILSQTVTIGSAGGTGGSLDDVRRRLTAIPGMAFDFGEVTPRPIFADAAALDFRPAKKSAAMDKGVKVFVPWSLSTVVGEWRFCRFNADPQRVLGENFLMNKEYGDRHMYYEIPRYDLWVEGATDSAYTRGELEDWTDGALVFTGTRSAVLRDADLKSDWSYSASEKSAEKITIRGAERETVDIDRSSFLIEAVFRTKPKIKKGTLVSKLRNSGYELKINPTGTVEFVVQAGAPVTVATQRPLNDGAWHHLIAEADRSAGALRLYVDGKLEAEVPATLEGSLANSADFIVGEGFAGALDFLRVTRSTLAESETTIEELYAWQFDGPFLRDFTGVRPAEGRRDAGAIESSP